VGPVGSYLLGISLASRPGSVSRFASLTTVWGPRILSLPPAITLSRTSTPSFGRTRSRSAWRLRKGRCKTLMFRLGRPPPIKKGPVS
jgi:hypothetical protein